MNAKILFVIAATLVVPATQLGWSPAASAAAITVNEVADAPVEDDLLIREIDDTIGAIDSALNDYIREYLASVGLNNSEFRPIERKLLRTVRQERKDDPATYRQVPENIHLLQAKVRFLQSAHPAFKDGSFPPAISQQFAKLGELEQRLRDDQAGPGQR